MKKVLITGANSYIGVHVEKWLTRDAESYVVDTIDMLDGSWRNVDLVSMRLSFMWQELHMQTWEVYQKKVSNYTIR